MRDAVQNMICPPRLCDVRIEGYAGRLSARFFEERVLSDEAFNVIFKEAEDAFRNKLDDQTIIGYWQGEFWGKLMISAARVCRYTGSERLRTFLRQAAQTMLSFQEEDGYIGTYRNHDFVCTPDVRETEKLVGWPCNWCWNIWCRKYTLWGLMELYDLLGDERILAACRRLADHLIAQLERLGKTLNETGTFEGMPSGSIIKPMLLLYRRTGDERYLRLCIDTAENWDRADGRAPNLIANALSGKPVADWYPGDGWAKAYEMMSCVDGLMELYRVTGTPKYLKAVRALYDLLNEHELNALFSVGFNDQFSNAAYQINAITEPCDVIHWMRMCYELFALTGESRYMDSFELAYHNAFLASSYKDGKWGARGVRSHGRHLVSHQVTFEHNHCCVDNMPRGYMNAAQAAVMHGQDGLYINLFDDFDAVIDCAGGQDVVNIRGSYTRDCRSTVTIEHRSAEAEKMRVRVPVWSEKSMVYVNGQAFSAQAGNWFEAELTPESVNRIDIEYDKTPRLRPFAWPTPRLDSEEWKCRRFCSKSDETLGRKGNMEYEEMLFEPRCTLMMGPMLLCRSKLIGNSEEEMFSAGTVFGKPCRVELEDRTEGEHQCVFTARLETPDGTLETRVCDYASAANLIVDDSRFFSIWF